MLLSAFFVRLKLPGIQTFYRGLFNVYHGTYRALRSDEAEYTKGRLISLKTVFLFVITAGRRISIYANVLTVLFEKHVGAAENAFYVHISLINFTLATKFLLFYEII